ncbi:hypothetical protein LOTGIDRAFT_233335 [Lottia gigantea]|uniref:UDP-N-acetylglucosamine diphosphorylase n=1 Tax=Lottia gigantea TaxID=225164 RepID=V4BS36_LOTGI|nr:hypothetical protein LOTGIDRAFT_233335 [Lottia gigantea]ESO91739.1 hypothetical protein LOTGIDRAFT_233335 [Lottia gigantea]
MDIESLKKKLNSHGQEELLKFWDTLGEKEQKSLYEQISSIDIAHVVESFKTVTIEDKNHNKIDDQMKPVSPDVFGSFEKSDAKTRRKYEERGLTEIGNNKVGVLLLAGGQGTRLGVNYPKGMVSVGLPSGKTLFQLQAERLLKLQQLAEEFSGHKNVIPWYIMTSEHTKEPTEAYFEKNKYFGLEKEHITIFEQSRLPCVSNEGEIILETPSKIAMAPDGNGGLYRAVNKHKVLDDMSKRGVQYVHVYCVDNILVKMADPIFLGFCIGKDARCGAKSVVKEFPTEPVGIICNVNGVYQVAEYSEISTETAEKKTEDGKLAFNAGNICNHFFTLDFLKEVASQDQEKKLKYHIAKKKIPYVNEEGKSCKPEKPNGIKMEKFVFDVFQFCTDKDFAVWEVLREEEFSPLKNANTAEKDNATTCCRAIYDLHIKYIERAGGNVVKNNPKKSPSHHSENDDLIVCEISPLVSYAGEGLENLVKEKTFVSPVTVFKTSDGTATVKDSSA